jgi:DNA mismatch repair ATPase MutL
MEAALMKVIGIISTAALSLILGTAALAYAQQDQDKPGPQDEKAQKDRSAKQEDKNTKQQDKNNTTQREKSAQQQDNNSKQEEKNAQQQNRNNKQDEKNTQQAQRAGSRGRIPDERFRANFGREHSFRVSQADYSRDRRFQYGGYSFVFVDAWPSNWLYTQDVFVVEIDGVYYLCNAMYPGVNITLNIAE